MNILGISAFYHDSAACLVQDGRLVAAAQEERFSRKKHDDGFPRHAVDYCLRAGSVGPGGIDVVAFYDKPITKFVRLLQTYFAIAPLGFDSFRRAMPVWLRQKLWIPFETERELDALGYAPPGRFAFPEHHVSHAASAFFPSPFASAAVLTLDGVGEWATSSIGRGSGHTLSLERELRFPHSLGLLYSAFTYFAGFKVNSGEYKLMGLAPYGEPRHVQAIYEHLIDLRDDGSFRVNMEYFDYLGGLTMTNARFAQLFGGPPRASESRITRREMDLARSIQVVTEEVVLRMARHAAKLTGERNVCLAGGVALNCVANGRLLREGPFERLWVQPAAGDAGGALGAALWVWHQLQGNTRAPDGLSDSMQGGYLGPSFTDDEIRAWLDANGHAYEWIPDDEARARRIAGAIANGEVVGLFLGRMEFGPRALGHRSIVGDARSTKMQSILNLKIKYRESFRPFAPSVLRERVNDYFGLDAESPYMLLVAPVLGATPSAAQTSEDMLEVVNESRSTLPSITHVDGSARIQTVSREQSPEYHGILKAFESITGCGVIINTSFNVRGEPIVCTPTDAYRCFMRTKMDRLVLGHCVLDREAQNPVEESERWRETFALD